MFVGAWPIFLLWALMMGGCGGLIAPSPHTWEFPCAVGDVTTQTATVWVKASSSLPVRIQYAEGAELTFMQVTNAKIPTGESDHTVKFHLSGLSPATPHVYRAVVEDRGPGPVCQFVTAPLPHQEIPVTFVIGADLRESYQPFTILEAMGRIEPDFFLLLGDTIYADKGFPAEDLREYWGKYASNRDIHLQRLLANTSVYVMWDDHEVDSNFIGSHPRIPIGRQAFLDYWPLSSFSHDPARLFRSFRWGKGLELILLDTRQYRNPSEETMLGREQKEWLYRRLQSSSAIFKIIATSVPFSDPRKDKWGQYQQERDEILRFIHDHGISGVVFLAADVHHAAVARVPGALGIKELIFGPLAAPMSQTVNGGDSRFEYFNDHTRNFGKITIQFEDKVERLKAEWFDQDGNILHHFVLGSDEKGMNPSVSWGGSVPSKLLPGFRPGCLSLLSDSDKRRRHRLRGWP